MKDGAEEDYPSNGADQLTIVSLGHSLIGWSYV